MEKYPENMMKAMGYFEIFYNQQLEDKKKSIKKFKENYPNINWITKKDIKTLKMSKYMLKLLGKYVVIKT